MEIVLKTILKLSCNSSNLLLSDLGSEFIQLSDFK